MIHAIHFPLNLRSFTSCSSLNPKTFFRQYSFEKHAKNFIMNPSHLNYKEIHSILSKGGEPFRRLAIEGSTNGMNIDKVNQSLAKKNIIKMNAKVYELGNTGWISKSYTLPGEKVDYNHLYRAVHAKRCRELSNYYNLNIQIPVKYLFTAPLQGLRKWSYPETYFLIYKKINLMPVEDFKNLLLKSDEQLREVTEKIAKFVRLTSYSNIHQKNFCFTTEKELALFDTESRHFEDTTYPQEINLAAYKVLNFMSKRKSEGLTENIFFYPPATEVFLKHANEIKSLLTKREREKLNLSGPFSKQNEEEKKYVS